MTTAIDTNVIVALWNPDDAQNSAAQRSLEQEQDRGALIICAAVYAELLAAPERSETFLDQFCEDTHIGVEWHFDEKVWRQAGLAFQAYSARRRKHKSIAPRRILADFLIGAHALVNGYKLLTLDARPYRASFPRLAVVVI